MVFFPALGVPIRAMNILVAFWCTAEQGGYSTGTLLHVMLAALGVEDGATRFVSLS